MREPRFAGVVNTKNRPLFAYRSMGKPPLSPFCFHQILMPSISVPFIKSPMSLITLVRASIGSCPRAIPREHKCSKDHTHTHRFLIGSLSSDFIPCVAGLARPPDSMLSWRVILIAKKSSIIRQSLMGKGGTIYCILARLPNIVPRLSDRHRNVFQRVFGSPNSSGNWDGVLGQCREANHKPL